MNYYIYILFSEKANRYYVGYSNDPWARLQQHNSNICDTFTGKFKPWILCAVFDTGTSKQLAIQTEKFIKQQKSRKLILQLLDPTFIPKDKLAQLLRVPHMRD